mgnify:CR=1 FL=1
MPYTFPGIYKIITKETFTYMFLLFQQNYLTDLCMMNCIYRRVVVHLDRWLFNIFAQFCNDGSIEHFDIDMTSTMVFFAQDAIRLHIASVCPSTVEYISNDFSIY